MYFKTFFLNLGDNGGGLEISCQIMPPLALVVSGF